MQEHGLRPLNDDDALSAANPPSVRRIPCAVVRLESCKKCEAAKRTCITLSVLAVPLLAVIICYSLLAIPLIPVTGFNAFAAYYGLAAVLLVAGAVLVAVRHANTHLRPRSFELVGLGSERMSATELLEMIERRLMSCPMKVGSVDTPWRSVKLISDQGKGRVSASLTIPVEFQNNFLITVDRELTLSVDAQTGASGGTDLKVTAAFPTLDKDQMIRTLQAVTDDILRLVMTQEVLQIRGERTPLRFFLPEPIESKEGELFLASVKGTAVIAHHGKAAVVEGSIEEIIRSAQRQAVALINASDMKDRTVTVKAAAKGRINEVLTNNDNSFELDEVHLEELTSNLPAVALESRIYFPKSRR